jgi:molybdopterin molybdotransferase
MLTVDEALARILAQVVSLPNEDVELVDAHGRVLGMDLTSPRSIPPWDNSSMDGYAVRAADTSADGVSLTLNETIAAGMTPTMDVGPGTASAIMTGAPMPKGADAVVMVERTDGSREGQVRVEHQATAGDYIRRLGNDVQEGSTVLRKGIVLGPAHVGMVASLGLATVPVVRRPVVAILSTGDEVVMPGLPLGPGQIYSSNNHTLTGMVMAAGGVPLDLGNAPDNLDALVERLTSALDADVVLTTGGVSVGAFDFVKDAYAALGVDIDFWKVRMKPGKPLAFGCATPDGRRVPLFGLPGNPVSCMVNFLQYVRPWIRSSMGDNTPFMPVIEAICAHEFKSKPGRARFERVVLESRKGNMWCRSTGSQGSGVLTSMTVANGFLLFPPEADGAFEGETVRVQLLDTRFMERAEPGYNW